MENKPVLDAEVLVCSQNSEIPTVSVTTVVANTPAGLTVFDGMREGVLGYMGEFNKIEVRDLLLRFRPTNPVTVQMLEVL